MTQAYGTRPSRQGARSGALSGTADQGSAITPYDSSANLYSAWGSSKSPDRGICTKVYDKNTGEVSRRGRVRLSHNNPIFVAERDWGEMPEAVEAMRTLRKAKPQGPLRAVSACDPLNLVVVLTTRRASARRAGQSYRVQGRRPVGIGRGGELRWYADADEATLEARCRAALVSKRRRRRMGPLRSPHTRRNSGLIN